MPITNSCDANIIRADEYQNLVLERDGDALYFSMNVKPIPCYTWALVRDIHSFQSMVAAGHERARCLVLASSTPGIFSLGGDLELFRAVGERRDRNLLIQYAELCATVLHNHMSAPDVVTVSLLEGDALGAGLESALASDIVVAEKGIRAGFPEVLFDLVPGHGAFYLLARKLGAKRAEALIRDGNVHSIEDLNAMGLIDVLAEPGKGRQAIRDLLRENQKSWNSFRALKHIKRHHQAITQDAILASAYIWVDAAMRLSPRSVRKMEKLVSAQLRRVGLAVPAMIRHSDSVAA